MRFSLFALLRLVVLLSVGAVLLAVSVARLVPSSGKPRTVAVPVYDVLNRVAFTPTESDASYLDHETGKVHEFKLPIEDRLDYAVCSPWTDERGEFEVVGAGSPGRWIGRPWSRNSRRSVSPVTGCPAGV